MALQRIDYVLKNIQRIEYLIEAGKESILNSILEGDFVKAKETATQVKELKLKLNSYKEQVVELEEITVTFTEKE